MEIQQGYSYHIKDEFFDLVQDKYLMSNKEQGKQRCTRGTNKIKKKR